MTTKKMNFRVRLFLLSLLKHCHRYLNKVVKRLSVSIMVSIYFLLINKIFRFLLSFIYMSYLKNLLNYSYFNEIFSHLCDFWYAPGRTLRNQMVSSEGSHGSEGESSKKKSFKLMKKIKALFHFKRESIPPEEEPITPESLIELEIHPNDTPNVLREKAAFLLSSYFA